MVLHSRRVEGDGIWKGRLTLKGPLLPLGMGGQKGKRLGNFVAAGPVSRILSAGLLRQDGHSSGPNITVRLKRPTRRLWRTEPARARNRSLRLPPYLVLLRVGFALPVALLRQRCALTAPFHPYPGVAARAVYFLWHFPSTGLEPGFPDVIRHTALRSSDFPPSPLDAARATVRSSCQQVHCNSRWSSVLGPWSLALGRKASVSDFGFSRPPRTKSPASKSQRPRTNDQGPTTKDQRPLSVRQVLIQLLNLPESFGHALIDGRQRK